MSITCGRLPETGTVTQFEDGVKRARFGRDNALYLLSRKNAPHGKILRLPLNSPQLNQAATVAPERKGVVKNFAPCDHGLYVAYLLGGPSELVYFPAGSTHAREIPILAISSVLGLDSWSGDKLTFGNVSYLKPFAWFTYAPTNSEPQRTGLYLTSPANFDDIEVVREFATSKDGTKVPLNILRKKGLKLNGQNPTILYGYGGYGINLTPSFDSMRRVWFDAGGVYVVANLRGGGEYGEEWHKAGNLTRKQNVFDDFIAAAEHLIQRQYTVQQSWPSRAAAMAVSSGRVSDSAARSGPGSGFPRRHLRHAPRRIGSEWAVQRDRIRNRKRSGAVQGALRLFALPSRAARCEIPGGLADHR